MQIQRIALAAVAVAAIATPTASAVLPTEPGSPSQAAAAAAGASTPVDARGVVGIGQREPVRSTAPDIALVRAKDPGVSVATALAGGLVLLAAILLAGTAVVRHRKHTSWA